MGPQKFGFSTLNGWGRRPSMCQVGIPYLIQHLATTPHIAHLPKTPRAVRASFSHRTKRHMSLSNVTVTCHGPLHLPPNVYLYLELNETDGPVTSSWRKSCFLGYGPVTHTLPIGMWLSKTNFGQLRLGFKSSSRSYEESHVFRTWAIGLIYYVY